MNRADTTMLLKRLHALYAFQRPADTDTIDLWAECLATEDAQEAFAALDRIVRAGEKAPSVARLISEINTTKRRPVPSTERPLGLAPTEEEKVRGRALIDSIRRSMTKHPSGPSTTGEPA